MVFTVLPANTHLWPEWTKRCAMTIVIAISFVVLDKCIQASTHLNADAFANAVLITQWSTDMSRFGAFVAGGLLLINLRRNAWACWAFDSPGQTLRWAILVLAASIAWPFLTLKHNLYFDQSYMLDRYVLLVSLIVLWWRPIAVVGVLISSYLLMWQYSWPSLGGPVFAHKYLTLELLTCFLAWHLLRAWRVPVKHSDLVIVIGVLVAGRYWAAGYTKLSLGWFSHGGLENALIAAHTHGWLASWSQETLLWMADILKVLGPVAQWGVLGFECLALILFINRRFAIAIIAAAGVFHVAVIVVYGFVFWTWIIVDLVFIALLRSTIAKQIFDGPILPRLAVTAALIGSAVTWTDATRLGWFDTPVSYAMRYSVTAEDGQDYAVSNQFFTPYEDRLTVFSLFGFLPDRGVLSGPYGVSQDADRAKALDALADVRDFETLQQLTPSHHDRAFGDQLKHFLARSMVTHNLRLGQTNWLNMMAPPAQMQSAVSGELPDYPEDLKILRAKAMSVTIWYHNDQIIEVERIPILDISIPDTAPNFMWQRNQP